ncbi:YqgE/AlgH family protein [Labilibaculum sp.]|uniref:YqgE/AlgH family protein n=1 Tax=Labilibaculum sp. TaxID=2060723 RepID=UPI00356A8EC9
MLFWIYKTIGNTVDSTSDFFRIEKNNIEPEKGKVLIAEPFLEGRYFKRSLVLLTECNKHGAVGLVLNKPINLSVDEALISVANFKGSVYVGGPVDPNHIYFLHTIPDLLPNSIHIFNGLYWGGDFEVLKNLIGQKRILPDQIRFFAGYAGWGAGQLNDEINENSWLVSQLEVDEIMNCDNEKLWEKSLRKMGGRYKMWSNFPENPGMN